MRGARHILIGLAVVAAASTAVAQDLSGPLAPPNVPAAASSTKPMKSTPRVARRAKAATTSKRTVVPASARLPTAARLPAVPEPGVEPAKAAAPGDPVSFGMKWNGSSDSAGQTRIENLNGGAVGTGAEVGMKLHF